MVVRDTRAVVLISKIVEAASPPSVLRRPHHRRGGPLKPNPVTPLIKSMLPFRVFGSPFGFPRPRVLPALVLSLLSVVLARRLSLPKHVTHIKSDFHALPRFLKNAISFLFLTPPWDPPSGTLDPKRAWVSAGSPFPPPHGQETQPWSGCRCPPPRSPPGARGTGSRCSSSSSSAASSPPSPSGPVGGSRGMNPFKFAPLFWPLHRTFSKNRSSTGP